LLVVGIDSDHSPGTWPLWTGDLRDRLVRLIWMPDFAQRILGALMLVVLAPLLVVIAVMVRASSSGPALYKAERIGFDGRLFRCLKFRTMYWQPHDNGGAITIRYDHRITRLGKALRRYRLDELPQLINVGRGEMNLIGPRPEDPRFVDFDDPLHRTVFRAKPGITGLAQLAFIDEADLLGTHQADADAFYQVSILPRKLALDARYLDQRSWRLDLWILGQTIRAVAGRRPVLGQNRTG
jgi:lipopolysaccharide/colanic/teichoic acid biosynthesis glycosyltransferase